jgi:hypothetical protein
MCAPASAALTRKRVNTIETTFLFVEASFNSSDEVVAVQGMCQDLQMLQCST